MLFQSLRRPGTSMLDVLRPNLVKWSTASLRTTAVLIAWICIGVDASAQSRFEEDFDDEAKPWQEIAVQMPPAPAADNLIAFYVSPVAAQEFALDAKSISLESDRVARFILVAKSQGGATNVSYEGIRCATFERKAYAFGRADGTWSRSRRDQWQPVSGNIASPHHLALAKNVICDGNTPLSPQEIVRRLKQPDSGLR